MVTQQHSWSFRPGILPALAVLVITPALVALGFWQLDRARQNRILHENLLRAQTAEAKDLDDASAAREDLAALLWSRVRVGGRFVHNIHILLDNQVHDARPGYHVFTPFQLARRPELVLLVNRGWVSAGEDRRAAPVLQRERADTELTLSGVIRPLPFSGIRMRTLPPERLAPGVYRVHSLREEELREQFGIAFGKQVLRLDPGSPAGYLRAWSPPRSKAKRNLAYAFQWFAMAATLLVIFVAVNLKRR